MAKQPPDIHVTITVDTSKFEAAMAKARESVETYAGSFTRTMQKIQQDMAASSRRASVMIYDIETFGFTPNQVWALYYARGGMDARYETPAQRDAYIRVLLRCGQHSDVAVAGFLRGWDTHRSQEIAQPFVWHRYIAGTRVEVSAA